MQLGYYKNGLWHCLRLGIFEYLLKRITLNQTASKFRQRYLPDGNQPDGRDRCQQRPGEELPSHQTVHQAVHRSARSILWIVSSQGPTKQKLFCSAMNKTTIFRCSMQFDDMTRIQYLPIENNEFLTKHQPNQVKKNSKTLEILQKILIFDKGAKFYQIWSHWNVYVR